MSGTEDGDDILDSPLLGDDYQEQLRRIASASVSPTPRRKTVPDTSDSELEEDFDEGDSLGDDDHLGDENDLPPQRYDFAVQTPSGATLPVLTEREVEYYEDRSTRYLTDHKFTSVTDLQDLDRVLSTELMLHRYDVWLTIGADYYGQAVSERDLLRYNKELQGSLQSLKKSMGLDKSTRDKDQGADFVAWLEDARRRAKEFGIMREEQLTVGITIVHEIKAKLQTYMNADAVERKELGVEPEAILQWMWDDVLPRFDAVDQHFRENSQRYWVSNL